MEIRILREPVALTVIAELAQRQFGEMLKAVVDVERRLLAAGGELHADAEACLLEDGSRQEDLWGINLYPGQPQAEWVEFDSMINVRPSIGNRSRGVDNEELRRRIREIVSLLIPR